MAGTVEAFQGAELVTRPAVPYSTSHQDAGAVGHQSPRVDWGSSCGQLTARIAA